MDGSKRKCIWKKGSGERMVLKYHFLLVLGAGSVSTVSAQA